MMILTEKKLMAFADGELELDDRAQMEAAVAANESVAEAVSKERLLRARIAQLYEPALHEPVPDQLRQAVGATGMILRFRSPAEQASRRPLWRTVAAIAATLIVGVLTGHLYTSTLNPASERSSFVAEGELGRALDVQLASAQPADAPIQLGISFLAQDGNPCRTFRSPDLMGLACRQNGRWTLRLTAPAERSASFEYQQAGGASALIMKSAQELMAGEPMGPTEERAARDSGWAPVGR